MLLRIIKSNKLNMKVTKIKDLINYLESFEQEYILTYQIIELTPVKDLPDSPHSSYIRNDLKYNFKYLTEMEKKSDKYRLEHASKYLEYQNIMREFDLIWSDIDYKKDIARLTKLKEELEYEINALTYNDHLTDKGKEYQKEIKLSILKKIDKAMQIAESINAESIELDERLVEGNILVFTSR